MAPSCEWKKIDVFLPFAGLGLKILPQLNIKAVYNLKPKSSGIILTPRLCPVCANFHISTILVSEVAYGEKCAQIFGLFWASFTNFATIVFQKWKCEHHPHISRHLCAKFDVLRPSQSRDIVWRNDTHPHPRHPDNHLISPSPNLSAPY